ncbi:MAG: F510_1955 family glycosylhydrolase [Solirubrobacterales bacterium]
MLTSAESGRGNLLCSVVSGPLTSLRVKLGYLRPLAVAAIASLWLAACGEENGDGATGAGGEGLVHVHGLGVNPADGALFIATHTGLFSSPDGASSAERVDEQFQDTMGFTVVGPDHFLASGHPAPGEDRPPNLGLIESTDGGRSWREVSLAGEADFHVLRFAHDRVYAYNSLAGELMLSDDGGGSWTGRRPPAPVIDLAVDPDDPERILASTEAGLALGEDDGRRWRRLPGDVGLLAWPEPRRLYLVNASGEVQVSEDGGGRWGPVGDIGGQPAALAAVGARELYAALADGTVLRSTDGGASWEVRSSP